ncbi:glucodextranase DOMON-like domain-containing protein [Algicola sagamiensis]|uniref:glucodextranase DOMON-like domain-containing protein n=1 Tax=Algicola sagamiensis TaxID=163869 RepID=UPI000361EDC8|nr:glucodextranase DOMON-like domain-containing protein [Algicola sagamiensis]
MIKNKLLFLALATAFSLQAKDHVFSDPRFDDKGSGQLIYPHNDAYPAGSLDITNLKISEKKNQYKFTLTLREAPTHPSLFLSDVGGDPMNIFAKHGFFTFNLDLYIDLDANPEHGFRMALPGRKVNIAPEFAWERVIVLTPRPKLARKEFKSFNLQQINERFHQENGKYLGQLLTEAQEEVSEAVDKLYYFPHKIQVSGKKVHFYIPKQFIGPLLDDIGITAVLTAADIDTGLNDDRMYAMGVKQSAGRNEVGVGHHGDPTQSPVIDVLGQSQSAQQTMLNQFDHKRFATIGGIRLNGETYQPKPAAKATKEKHQKTIAEVEVLIQETFRPASTANHQTQAEEKAPNQQKKTTSKATLSIAERLKQLKSLKDQALISHDEYTNLRQRILNEL